MNIKKRKLALTRVLTEQERRDKWQQCQTQYSAVQYSAVHGAGCVGRLSKYSICVAFKEHQSRGSCSS
jgi:hypothetical protein